jgi:glutamate synthase domain-containing protein 2/glutamate synthase domain-containing protein 1/glutamate synthase domain-containing protein 3
VKSFGLPEKQGLYDPAFEHDACGIGFVADLKGRKSHELVEKGIQVLVNLQHRGACGCDDRTGDGAGLTLQIPHEFFAQECGQLGFSLPEQGQYGVGMLFLPKEDELRAACEQAIEQIVAEEGQRVLGWRTVPVDASPLGRLAAETQPAIRQIFIGAAPGLPSESRPRREQEGLDEAALNRKLFVIRKRAQAEMRKRNVPRFYVPSMSASTIVYKGLLLATQIAPFYQDLQDPALKTGLVLIHQRYSTNTFPCWELAHPFRYIAHNGEINTLKGNINWMHARESVLASPLFGDDIKKLFPIIEAEGSDSAMIDNAIELLLLAGRSLPHAMMMVIPEAWSTNPHMPGYKRAFYEYHASLMEPWDGPAAMVFTDGRVVGGTLDRNGLRPCRYTVTHDDLVIMASETGVLPLQPGDVKHKGRLQPGRMFLVDTVEGRIIEDEEIKKQYGTRHPYERWLEENLIEFEDLPAPESVHAPNNETLLLRQRAFGYTQEDLRMILGPMAAKGEEPVGSMGTDTPLACLSDKPQLLFHYFKQLFAQVTNPPIDSIREELVMSLISYIGQERNILDETPTHCHLLKIRDPILTNRELEKIRTIRKGDFLAITLPTLFRVADGGAGLERALDELCQRASQAVQDKYSVIILSDRDMDQRRAPIPSLLALAAVHNHLVREETRTQCALVVESGEPREVHHFALLIGYGASAVNPYLALETLGGLVREAQLPPEITWEKAVYYFTKAVNKGLLKVFSKMGISTLQSYRGAQIFEAIGLNQEVIERYFTGTASRIEGIGLDVIAQETAMRHAHAFQPVTDADLELDVGGQYQYRVRGEFHLFNPLTVAKLQHAVRQQSYATFQEYSRIMNDYSRQLCQLRGLLDFKKAETPVPIEEVEPASEIVKHFATGAMSYGSISKEAHETLAIAMNRIGGKSNTGEGGEDEDRYIPDPNGDLRSSAIKQVASARFGVTTTYLVNAKDLQIKMAQGAKPGEGGQLPGHKVSEGIAKTRHSIPGVQLISPPPHHDIYSIEDLAQLIHDLKNANPQARIAVKLVAEVGVGTVAAGVSKGHADVVLISGDTGGTGASPLSSMKHAGIPWELGLAETQQVLVLNDLRGRIVVQTDGKLTTGRDVAVAALLGAEEFGFSTAPLISMGCIMMRKCHLNTCPVGVATQDPVLRAKFTGVPENVIQFFFFIAEELREIMAQLGFRRMDEMIGRSDLLKVKEEVIKNHWKAKGLDLSSILYQPPAPPHIARRKVQEQDHGLEKALDYKLIELAKDALEGSGPVEIKLPIRNIHRTVGTMLSSEIAKRYGSAGLPEDFIHCHFTGSAGQSFGAFAAKGLTLVLEGDANDYTGKGLSGGRMIIYPPKGSNFVFEENILVGNVVLYGATSGEAYFNGMAGERFAVRNSGATAVVEGVGDHGCEYMTRGLVAVLGKAGRNFAAGMSGGIAYVLDEADDFAEKRCNLSMVDLEPVADEADQQQLRQLIERHFEFTQSPKAEWVLENWETMLPQFVKVFPHEYKRVLKEQAAAGDREQVQHG